MILYVFHLPCFSDIAAFRWPLLQMFPPWRGSWVSWVSWVWQLGFETPTPLGRNHGMKMENSWDENRKFYMKSWNIQSFDKKEAIHGVNGCKYSKSSKLMITGWWFGTNFMTFHILYWECPSDEVTFLYIFQSIPPTRTFNHLISSGMFGTYFWII
jgi:hypothetical protein